MKDNKIKKEIVFTHLKIDTEIGFCHLICSTDDLSVLFNIFKQSNLEIDCEIDFDFDEEAEINPDYEMLKDFINFVNKLKGHKCGIGDAHIQRYFESKNN